MNWTVVQYNGNRADLESLGSQGRKMVRCPKEMSRKAFQHWVGRGMPLGSPEVDWFAAERALYESLVASGLVSPFRKQPAGHGAGDLSLANLPNEGRRQVRTDSRMP